MRPSTSRIDSSSRNPSQSVLGVIVEGLRKKRPADGSRAEEDHAPWHRRNVIFPGLSTGEEWLHFLCHAQI